MFAEQGYNGVALRQVCLAAGVNLALMSYHFGTKERLLREIFERGTRFINAERSRLMVDLEDRRSGRQPSLDEVLTAFITPTLSAPHEKSEEELHFLKLSGRLATDPTPEVRRVMSAVYDSVAFIFVRLLRRACPHLADEEFFARLVFFYGAMLYTRAETGRVLSLAANMQIRLNGLDGGLACRYIVTFLAAGFRAPGSSSS